MTTTVTVSGYRVIGSKVSFGNLPEKAWEGFVIPAKAIVIGPDGSLRLTVKKLLDLVEACAVKFKKRIVARLKKLRETAEIIFHTDQLEAVPVCP